MPKRPRIVITMGDPAGIGPEVSLRSLSCAELLSVCQPILLGDRSALKSVAERCDLEIPGQFLTQSEFESVQENESSDPLLIDFQNVDLDELRPGEAFRCGFLFGLGMFAAGTWWLYISISGFGGAPLSVAFVLMGSLMGAMGLYLGVAGFVLGFARTFNKLAVTVPVTPAAPAAYTVSRHKTAI